MEVATEGDVMVMSGNNNSAMDDEADEEDGGLVIGDSYNGGQHRANTVSEVVFCYASLFCYENSRSLHCALKVNTLSIDLIRLPYPCSSSSQL